MEARRLRVSFSIRRKDVLRTRCRLRCRWAKDGPSLRRAIFAGRRARTGKDRHMSKPTTSPTTRAKDTGRPIAHDDVVRLIGDLEDAKVSAIMTLGPTVEELEEAITWAESEDDVMGALRKPLDGKAARVYEILITRKDFGDDER